MVNIDNTKIDGISKTLHTNFEVSNILLKEKENGFFFGKTLFPKQSQMEAAASRRQKAKFTSVKYRHDGII